MSAIVGLIVHAASGKDIRRLVAQATTVSDQAKVNIVAQSLVGLGALGVTQALLMPDQQKLGERAVSQAQRQGQSLPWIIPLQLPVMGTAEDTTRAAAEMRTRGAGSIIVLGGDGTARAASLGAGETPLLPVSTGTNNVLPYFIEGVIAGLAAGAVARGIILREQAGYRHKRLVVTRDGAPLDVALVDVALIAGRFAGSRAVWQGEDIRQVWVTRAEAHNVGLTSIVTRLKLIGPRDLEGHSVTLDSTSTWRVMAVLAPGLVSEVGVAAGQELCKNRPAATLVSEPSILTLDGEREHALPVGARLAVTLQLDGPWLIDPQLAMRAWAEQELLQLNDRGKA